MTIPYIAGWGDTIKANAPQLGEAIRTFINPKWREEEAMKMAVMQDPTLIEKFAKINQDNPDAFAQIYGPKAQQWISTLKTTPEQQVQRQVTTAAQGALATPEGQTEAGARAAGTQTPAQREVEQQNVQAGRQKAQDVIDRQARIVRANAAQSLYSPLDIIKAVKDDKVKSLKVGGEDMPISEIHQTLYEEDAGYKALFDAMERADRERANASERADAARVARKTDLQIAREKLTAEWKKNPIPGATIDDYIANVRPDLMDLTTSTPEGRAKVQEYDTRKAALQGLDRNTAVNSALRQVILARMNLAKAKGSKAQQTAKETVATAAQVLNGVLESAGASYRVDTDGNIVDPNNVKYEPQSFLDWITNAKKEPVQVAEPASTPTPGAVPRDAVVENYVAAFGISLTKAIESGIKTSDVLASARKSLDADKSLTPAQREAIWKRIGGK